MTHNANDVNWILLGFRLGQLTDVCDQQGRNDDHDEELVGSLIANLEINASSCINTTNVQPVVRLIKEIGGTWRDRESLAREDGTGKPYELIYGACARLERTIRQTIQSPREATAFKVGQLLGQSSGWYGTAEETCWCYRNLTDLIRELAKLGATLTDISDLPEINHAEEFRGFASTQSKTHSNWRETRKRYPRHRWGWAFIEDQLFNLAIEVEGIPNREEKSTQSHPRVDSATDDLGKCLNPLTSALHRRIVEVLWKARPHWVSFETLRERAWEGDDIQPGSIERRLKDIQKKWVGLQYKLRISGANAQARILPPGHKAATEK